MRQDDWTVRLLLAGAAATGIASLLLDVYGVIRMPFTLSFVAIPATLAVVLYGVWAGRTDRHHVLRRLWVGLVAGTAATATYDISRAIVAVASPASFDPFRAHPNFGALMLDTSPDTTAALVAGWGYHFWNGLSFAVIYTLLAGGVKARWAVAWALLLEVTTIVVTPRYAGVSRTDVAFIVVSVVGHLIYGATLGPMARSWLPGERDDGPLRLGPVRWRGDVW